MNDQRQTARTLLRENAFTLDRLWARYWALGGDGTAFELDAYVHEALEPPPLDLSVIAWAIKDLE